MLKLLKMKFRASITIQKLNVKADRRYYFNLKWVQNWMTTDFSTIRMFHYMIGILYQSDANFYLTTNQKADPSTYSPGYCLFSKV